MDPKAVPPPKQQELHGLKVFTSMVFGPPWVQPLDIRFGDAVGQGEGKPILLDGLGGRLLVFHSGADDLHTQLLKLFQVRLIAG